MTEATSRMDGSGRRLDLSRVQVLGAAAIVAVVGLWAILLPLAGGLVETESSIQGGKPISVGGGATMVPAEGWSLDPTSRQDIITVMTKGSATMTIVAATDSTGPLLATLQRSTIDALHYDPTGTHWESAPIARFETDAGLPGGSVSGHSTRDVVLAWVVDDGSRSITVLGSTDEGTFTKRRKELEAMIRSIVLEAPPEPGQGESP